MDSKKALVRWPRLLIGAVMMLFAGVIYAWSILKTPLSEEFGWSASTLALNFTLTNASTFSPCRGMPVA